MKDEEKQDSIKRLLEDINLCERMIRNYRHDLLIYKIALKELQK